MDLVCCMWKYKKHCHECSTVSVCTIARSITETRSLYETCETYSLVPSRASSHFSKQRLTARHPRSFGDITDNDGLRASRASSTSFHDKGRVCIVSQRAISGHACFRRAGSQPNPIIARHLTNPAASISAFFTSSPPAPYSPLASFLGMRHAPLSLPRYRPELCVNALPKAYYHCLSHYTAIWCNRGPLVITSNLRVSRF